MNLLRMALAEMRHRWATTALSVLAVAVAVAAALVAVGLLRAYDRQAQTAIDADQARLEQDMKKFEEDYRKITKQLGFNVLILPKDQNLADFYAEDYAARTMPESYVDVLAKASVVTVQHLAPTLQQRITWPERKRTVLVVGVRGETPISGAGADAKAPIQAAVAPGAIVVGHELHASLGIAKGDTVALMGREFKVESLREPRGNKDDITLWINLRDAQDLLDKPGQINGILALQCQCAWADLPKIRAEIVKLLPRTQVIEFRSQALTRAEARWRAAEAAQAALENQKAQALVMSGQRKTLAATLVPAIALACALGVALLALFNGRERRVELGLLRAIGFRTEQVMRLFIAKLVAIGVAGAVVGVAVACVAIARFEADAAAPLSDWRALAAALVAAPALALIAGWLPAQLAAQRDPADVLREA